MGLVSLRTRDEIRACKIGPVNPSPFAYAPAPESVRPALKPSYGLFIGGSFVAPRSGRSFRTINPATEEPIAEVADAGAADVARAVEAARKAFPKWSKTKPAEAMGLASQMPIVAFQRSGASSATRPAAVIAIPMLAGSGIAQG